MRPTKNLTLPSRGMRGGHVRYGYFDAHTRHGADEGVRHRQCLLRGSGQKSSSRVLEQPSELAEPPGRTDRATISNRGAIPIRWVSRTYFIIKPAKTATITLSDLTTPLQGKIGLPGRRPGQTRDWRIVSPT